MALIKSAKDPCEHRKKRMNKKIGISENNLKEGAEGEGVEGGIREIGARNSQ